MPAHLGVDVDALDLDEARLAIGKAGARDGPLARVGHDRQLDIGVESPGLFLPGGGNPDAAFAGQHRGRHHVHRRIGGLHDARDGGTVQRGQVHVAHRAVIQHVDRLDRLVRHLADKGPKMPGQPDPGPHDGSLFRRDRRHVQRVLHRPGPQVIGHLSGHLKGHVFLGLGRGCPKVGCDDDIGQVEQGGRGGGFFGEDIEGGPGHMARGQGGSQGHLVHQAATGAVDDAHAGLAAGNRPGRQDVAGLVGQRHVQGDEIGAGQQIIQFHLGHAKQPGAFLAQERVIGHDLHLQAQGTVADDAADISGPDHAQRLVEQLRPHEAGLFPFAGMGRCVRFGNLAGDGEHHRNGMFGGGDGIAEGRVHHDHAFLRRRRDIDIVHANACAAHHLQIGGQRQKLFGDFGGRADGKAVILADDGGKRVFVLAEFRQVINVNAAVAEDLDGGFGKLVGNEDFGGHGGLREWVGVAG